METSDVATKQDKESSRKKSSSQRTSTSTCEECRQVDSVYVCPGCQIRTCSLKCVQAHKERTQCSGKRNRSEFLPVCRMTDNTLRNDYFFLEDVLNQTSNKKLKTETSNSNASPNKNRRRLVSQAQQRGVTLQLMPSIMERSKKNSSFYSAQKDLITWRVEVIMVSSEPTKNVTFNLCENETNVMEHIEKRCNQSLPSHSLFLKLPSRAHNNPQYLCLEPNDSLQQSLRGQTIIEHPTIFCVPEDKVQDFPTGTDKIETIDEQPTTSTSTDTSPTDKAAKIETRGGDLNP
jgi:hypothetical protein